VKTDLAPLENGGLVLAASDIFIGAPHSLISSRSAVHRDRQDL
jgi:hypothetical protein